MRSLIVRSLNHIRNTPAPDGNRIAEAMDDFLKGHSNVAKQLATDPNGGNVVPANVSQVQAQHLGNGVVDVSITDNSPIARAINYHVEYDSSSEFTNPRGAHLGPWRTGTVVLPNGNWHVRAYSQYPAGGPPSDPVYAGMVTVAGAASGSLFPSQSSGTGKPQQGGGQGSGKVIQR